MTRLRPFLTAANLCRAALLVICLLSLQSIRHEKPPWKSSYGRHLAEGKEPTFKESVQMGRWYGAVTRAGLCAAVLIISLAWGLKKDAGIPAPLRLAANGGGEISSRTFSVVLGLIVLGALFMRLPRMTHSFWGDESDAIATYVTGTLRPADDSDPQGRLVNDPATWSETFYSARHGANNHVLFSISSRLCLDAWRKITGRAEWEFAEWPARVPSLLAGVGSLVAFALLLRRWGAPKLALLATAFMALHPWHVRYSTEARGYALMLLFFPLLLIALTDALEKNRWRDWLVFGLLEFLLMYSWGGIVYALAAVNVVLVTIMLLRTDRVVLFTRWATAGLLAAAAFIPLYLPHLPQITAARARLLWIKGLPMDTVWFHNLLCQPFAGIPWHQLDAGNTAELSWEWLFQASPFISIIGFTVILASFFAGLIFAWKRNRLIATIISSVFLGAVVCTLHFKFILKDELRAWYLIFTLPCVCICVAAGFQSAGDALGKFFRRTVSPRFRAVLPIVLLILTTAATWPMTASLMTQPEENYKDAAAATIGRHETGASLETSRVFTIWLWRYSPLYAPRGDKHARDSTALRQRMDQARTAHGELYVIVGYRAYAETNNTEMLAMLDDPALFEKRETFPARESLHTLQVYRMK